MSARRRGIVGPSAVAIVAVVLLARGAMSERRPEAFAREAPAPSVAASASPSAYALVGVREGDALGAFRVTSVRGPAQKRIEVVLDGTLVVFVTPRGSTGWSAPADTPLHEIFYDTPRTDAGLDAAAILAACRELAARVRANETRVTPW